MKITINDNKSWTLYTLKFFRGNFDFLNHLWGLIIKNVCWFWKALQAFWDITLLKSRGRGSHIEDKIRSKFCYKGERGSRKLIFVLRNIWSIPPPVKKLFKYLPIKNNRGGGGELGWKIYRQFLWTPPLSQLMTQIKSMKYFLVISFIFVLCKNS